VEDPVKLWAPGADGLRLAAEAFGAAGDPVVLLAHGGGQSRHVWADTARLLAAAGYLAIALDSRGHGDSDWSVPPRYEPEDFARDFASVARWRLDVDGRAPHFVGASLAGIAGLIAAGLLAPPAFATLTLVDVVPDFRTDALDKARDLFALGHNEGFASDDDAARALGARPGRIQVARFMRRGADGRWRWRWDPAFAERIHHDDLTRARCAGAARALSIPVHLIRAGRSEFVDRAATEAFRAMTPHLRVSDLPEARHVVTGDPDGAYARKIRDFLDSRLPPR